MKKKKEPLKKDLPEDKLPENDLTDDELDASYIAYQALLDEGLSKDQALKRTGLTAQIVKDLEEEKESDDFKSEFEDSWESEEDDNFDLDDSAWKEEDIDEDDLFSGGGSGGFDDDNWDD